MTLAEYGAGQQNGTGGLLDQSWGGSIPQHSCPNCGYCPYCGRSNHTYPYQPYYPYPRPYIGDAPDFWKYNTVTCGSQAQAVQGTIAIN